MGLEVSIQNKFDGKPVPAYHLVDLVNIDFFENRAQVYGRVFISSDAYTNGFLPIDTFSFVFYDFRALMQSLPSAIEGNAYAWLKSLPEFVGAIEKIVPAPVPAPIDPPSTPDVPEQP